MTLLLVFFHVLIIVCMMPPSTVQMSTTYVQRNDPTYHFHYNVNKLNEVPRKSQEEMRNENVVISGSYFIVTSDGFRQNNDYEMLTQHQRYNVDPKNSGTMFLTLQETLVPESSYEETLHPGYPHRDRPMVIQFNPASGVRQIPHRIISGYDRDKLPPGYVPLVAKINTPKGYKLLDEKKLTPGVV